MRSSTRRAIRTALHAFIALVTVIPLVLAVLPAGTPIEADIPVIVAGIAAVSKALNAAEEAGLIPAWLKDELPAAPETPAAPAEGDAPAVGD